MKNIEAIDKDNWPDFTYTHLVTAPINIMNDALLFKLKVHLIHQSTGSYIGKYLVCLVIGYIVFPNIIDLLKTKTINHKKVISLQIVYTKQEYYFKDMSINE